MASGAQPVRPGATALALVVAGLTLAPTALLLTAGASLRPADLAALRFTLTQAALAALISALLAIPIARALARRNFPGKGLTLTLMGAPFLLPVIVAVLGLLTVFGRAGWINAALTALHLPNFTIYGLQGVVLADVFLNLPLAIRMLLVGWQSIPAERFRLAETLGLPPRAIFRHLEAPMLREELPGIVVTIFLICLTSFAIALILGGGPRATTLELAIYQAIRYDFDLGHAATLGLMQFATCTAGVILAASFTRSAALGAGLGRLPRIPAPKGWRRAADILLIATGLAFLTLPLLAIFLNGAADLPFLPAQVWRAAALSTGMALASAALSSTSALFLALAIAARARGSAVLELTATLPLAASGLVIGTGLFIALRPFASPDSTAIPVTIVTNAAMALPFGFRLLLPEARRIEADYGRLAAALGLTGRARLLRLDLPRLARPLGLATGLAAALAMGDLGVIALFATGNNATLPLVIQQLMSAYRMGLALSAATLLVGLSFALYAVFDLWGRRHAAA